MVDKDALKRLREKSLGEVRGKMKESIGRDKIIAQAVSATDDLSGITNLLSERLHEWYGLYHPEFRASDNKKYAEAIAKGKDDRRESSGIDLEQEDIKALIHHANVTLSAFRLKEDTEEYVKDVMNDIAPNTSSIAGPVIGAKLIAFAGSLEKLAKMPASTIQLLGAEKSLFRFIKEQKKKGKPPKYGILFTHDAIQKTKPEHRGKAARLLSAKISMAAKTDFYSKEDRSKKYKEDLEKKLKPLR